MPPRRHDLIKMLDAVEQPVYALDDECRILYCNRACADWAGCPAEQLVGQPCRYHSESVATGPAAAAAAMCPPPAVIAEGQAAAGTLTCTASDGRLSHRHAQFLPFTRDAGETAGILVVVSCEELAGPAAGAPASADASSAELHARLQRFRLECRGRRHVDQLLGDSPAMRQVRRQVALAAAGRSSVLVVGPAGSDREGVARAVHYGDADPGSLVPLSCSLLSGEMLRSTLAAVVRSHAEQKPSATSTLLLGDVDLLPSDLQASLATILAPASGRLRVMGTSRETLERRAARGEFPAALAAELSTLVIRLPALTERLEDLPLLVQQSLEEENARGGKQLAGFTPEAIDRLLAYRWPGDVAELAQIVRAACSTAAGPDVAPKDLPERLLLAAQAEAQPRRVEERIVLEAFLARIELELIQRALTRSKGNKTKAAQLLGMTRPRLYRRLVQLGLVKDDDQAEDAE